MKHLLAATALPIGLCAALGSGQAAVCTADTVPAATLLVPYFEVDLDACDTPITGRTTTVTLSNTATEAKLAHVTIWTNAGVPVFTFDVYLNAFSRQDLNLSDLLCEGALPTTGRAFDQGFISAPVSFPNCNNTATVGDAPAYGGAGAIAPAELAALTAALTGGPDPTSGMCTGIDLGDNAARGYLTIDNVAACTESTPASPGYFVTDAGFENVLSGQFSLIDSPNNFAAGFAAVAIEAADPATFAPGDATFYGRYVFGDASDRREPLGTTHMPRFVSQSAFASTDLLVWRETDGSPAPFTCGAAPSWAPLTQTNDSNVGAVFAIDEDGNHLPLAETTAFSLATQRVSVGDAFPAVERQVPVGSLWLNLQHGESFPSSPGQAWVTSVLQSEGRFSTAAGAQPLDTSCDGMFDNTTDGPVAIGPF